MPGRALYLRFAARRGARAILTLALIVTLVFLVLRLSGNPARILLAPDAPKWMVEAYGKRLGIDRPLIVQYTSYILALASGDMGESYLSLRPAIEVLLSHLSATLELGATGLAFALGSGVPLGILAALHHRRGIDRAAMAVAVLGHSLPSFFLGILLILVFSVTLHIFPSGGGNSLRHLVLPAITLGTANAGILARFARSALLETLHQPYFTAARTRGVPYIRAVLWHALPNASVALLAIIGLLVGATIVGAIITETIFAWPGLGYLFVVSVASRDLPVVQAIVLLSAATMVTANLLVDLLQGWLDPRIRVVQ